tara:strand:+ start:391 stop:1236 length:846 start_codon:yes stop_codon:yes gene_type:complete
MTETYNHYSLFNFSIKSDVNFIGIPITKKQPDLILQEDLNLEKKTSKTSLQELSIDKGWIENKELIAEIKPEIIKYKFLVDLDTHTKQTKLLHQTLPSALFQNNRIALHGSAFVYKDVGILVCGPSTFGKSETINVLSTKFKVISDDIIGLEISKNTVTILPGLPFTSIQHGEDGFSLNDRRKRFFKAFHHEDICYENTILKKIIILDWGSEYKYKKLNKQEAFKQILANSFRPLPSSNCLESEKMHFQNLANLIKYSDQYIFERKKGDIEASIKLLLKNL